MIGRHGSQGFDTDRKSKATLDALYFSAARRIKLNIEWAVESVNNTAFRDLSRLN